MARTRLLHRPADRLQGLPAALRQDGSEPEFARHPARYLRAGPQATIGRRLKQTSLELLQQVRPQDRGAGAVPALQITQSLGTSPPIIFPGGPERWWGDEALKAETDTPQATLEQRHQAAGDVLALRCRGFFSAGALFSRASHIPVETAP